LQIVTIKLNLSDAARSSAVGQAADAAGAAKVEEQLKVFQRNAKEGINEQRKELAKMPEEFRKEAEEMMSVAEKLLDALTWTKSGTRVTVTLKGDKGLIGEAFAKTFFSWVMPRPARVSGKKRAAPEPVPNRSDEKRE